MNFTGWSHARFPALAAAARTPGDSAWAALQDLWAQNPAALPILDFRSVIWVNKRLRVEASPLGLYLATPGAAGWRWDR